MENTLTVIEDQLATLNSLNIYRCAVGFRHADNIIAHETTLEPINLTLENCFRTQGSNAAEVKKYFIV